MTVPDATDAELAAERPNPRTRCPDDRPFADTDRRGSSNRPGRTTWHSRPSAYNVALVLVSIWGLYQTFWRMTFPRAEADEPAYAISAWYYIHGDHHPVPVSVAASSWDAYEHPPLARFLFGLGELPVGHPSIYADRLVAGLCVLVTAGLLGWWLSRVAGRWTGLFGAALMLLLPMRAGATDFSIDRYGILDPVAEMFMVASVVLAWAWWRSHGRQSWWLATALGACTGLAASAKENAFLGVVGPVLLVLLLAIWRGRRTLLARTLQATGAAAVAAAVFLVSYLPMPHPLTDLRYLIRFQTNHSNSGHLVGFAGRVSARPPWWTNLWDAGHSLGVLVVVVTLVGVGAAVLIRPQAAVGWWVAALVGPLAFHLFVAGVALPYYWVMWMPACLVLVALGVRNLATAGPLVRSWPRRAGRSAPTGAALATICVMSAAGVGLCLTGVSLLYSYRLAALRLDGPAALAKVMTGQHLQGGVLLFGINPWETYGESLPAPVTSGMPASLDAYRTIVVSAPRCGDPLSIRELQLVETNLSAARLRIAYTDARMTVYQSSEPLRAPGAGTPVPTSPQLSDSYRC